MLETLYQKSNVNQSDLQELGNMIMDGKADLKFKEFYNSIQNLTTYKWNENDFTIKLERLISDSTQSDQEFDTAVDKTYINIILSKPNSKCNKFELLNVFYKSPDKYKEYAKKLLNKKSRSDDKLEVEETKKPSILIDKEKKADTNEENKPKGGKVI